MKHKEAKIKPLRKWLNPIGEEDTGHVTVTGYRYTGSTHGATPKPYHSLELTLDLGDCYKKIGLNFCADKKKKAKKRLKKLAIIQEALDKVKKELENYIDEV
jgi:hypothetical protein